MEEANLQQSRWRPVCGLTKSAQFDGEGCGKHRRGNGIKAAEKKKKALGLQPDPSARQVAPMTGKFGCCANEVMKS